MTAGEGESEKGVLTNGGIWFQTLNLFFSKHKHKIDACVYHTQGAIKEDVGGSKMMRFGVNQI